MNNEKTLEDLGYSIVIATTDELIFATPTDETGTSTYINIFKNYNWLSIEVLVSKYLMVNGKQNHNALSYTSDEIQAINKEIEKRGWK